MSRHPVILTMKFSRWISVSEKNLLQPYSQFYPDTLFIQVLLTRIAYPPSKCNTTRRARCFRKAATTPYNQFGKVSVASTDSWISNSYQEVPPMTDFLYHEAYDKTPANQGITTSPNTLTVPCDESPKLSDECKYASQRVTEGNVSFVCDCGSG
jgi:hypothetical protein